MVQVTKKIRHKKEKTQKSFEFLVLNFEFVSNGFFLLILHFSPLVLHS
jgi:hypothetical protein